MPMYRVQVGLRWARGVGAAGWKARPSGQRREATMQLEIPDDIVRQAEANASDLRLSLAIQLYADNRIDHPNACRLAGLSAAVFNRELLTRQIGIQQYPQAKPRPHREAS